MDKLKKFLKYWPIPVIVFFIGIVVILKIIVSSGNNEIPTVAEPEMKKISKPEKTTKIDDYEKEEKRKLEATATKETKEEILKQDFSALDISDKNNKSKTGTPVLEEVKAEVKEKNTVSQLSTNKFHGNQKNVSSTYNTSKNTESIKQEPVKRIETKEKNKVNSDPFGIIKSAEYTKDQNASVKQSNQADLKNGQEGTKANYMRGEIYGDQLLEEGSSCVFRLKQSINYKGTLLPVNSLLYGKAYFTNKRVNIHIHLCKTPQGNYNVSFDVVDSDYIEGIYYKSKVDKSIDKTKEDASSDILDDNTIKAKLINSAVKNISKAATSQQSETLKLEDGYVVYFIFSKK